MHEGERHKLRESACLALQVAECEQVVDAVVPLLYMAEHHGGGGLEAHLMRGAHHLEPLAGVDASRPEGCADVVVEDLGAGAGEGVDAGLFELCEEVAEGPALSAGAELHLFGRKSVQVELGEGALQRSRNLGILPARHARREPGLHADLGGPHRSRLGRAPHHLFERQVVALLGAEVAGEGAEAAGLHADIGEVDVPIDHVGHQLARLPGAEEVGYANQGVERIALDAR